ncbi:hypothetical protein CBS101457_002441 [Exobasidium rhododendri]|nr:hypothetical protein CBS101457_002441 [Exobasidium rhododendri]
MSFAAVWSLHQAALLLLFRYVNQYKNDHFNEEEEEEAEEAIRLAFQEAKQQEIAWSAAARSSVVITSRRHLPIPRESW